MPNIDPFASLKLQPEVLSGESIYWAAMPNPRKIFHSDDWTLIPFSLLWGGFAIFWEATVLGYVNFSSKSSTYSAPSFFVLWGIPFVLYGQYMIWGRFIVDGWLKRRTFYAVTNRRVLSFRKAGSPEEDSFSLNPFRKSREKELPSALCGWAQNYRPSGVVPRDYAARAGFIWGTPSLFLPTLLMPTGLNGSFLILGKSLDPHSCKIHSSDNMLAGPA